MRHVATWLGVLLLGIFSSVHAGATFQYDLDTIDNLLKGVPAGPGVVRKDDMLFRTKDLLDLKRRLESRKQPRAAIRLDVTTWTGGRVYYTFAPGVSSTNRERFLAACADWTAAANVEFLPRTNQSNYILVMNADDNSSYVGMVGGMQELHMYNWSEKYVICHELGHALGFEHEQCRSDRDTYVTIYFDNIQSGMAYNFDKMQTTNSTPYDFDSVMHYGMYAFSKNGQATIVPKRGYESAASRMGQRKELSFYDKKAMSALYGAQAGVALEGFTLRDEVTSGLPNNGNGRVDAGEHITLVLNIRNSTSAAVPSASAAVSNYPTFLTFSRAQGNATNIPVDQVASISLPFVVAPSAKLEPELPVRVTIQSSVGTSQDTIYLPGLPPGDPPTVAPTRVRVKKLRNVGRRVEGTLSFVCKDSEADVFQIESSGRMKTHSWSSPWTSVRRLTRRDGLTTYSAKIRVKAADQLQFRVRAVNVYGNLVSKIITVRR